MIIKDCIYRFITVPELCEKFINTVEFQRLRHIKQLGLSFYVCPGAVHTRFEHCVGVMHLAGKVVDKLRIAEKSAVISEREKELVQLAGVLHDVGHVAFSHLFDYILKEEKEEKDKIIPELSTHEMRSVLILNRINSRLKLLSPKEEESVGKMILGLDEKEEKP